MRRAFPAALLAPFLLSASALEGSGPDLRIDGPHARAASSSAPALLAGAEAAGRRT